MGKTALKIDSMLPQFCLTLALSRNPNALSHQ